MKFIVVLFTLFLQLQIKAQEKIKLRQKDFEKNITFKINDTTFIVASREAFYEYYTRGRDVSKSCVDFLQLLQSNEKNISSEAIPKDKNSVCMVFTQLFLREQLDKGNVCLKTGREQLLVPFIFATHYPDKIRCDRNSCYSISKSKDECFFYYESMCKLQ